MNKINNILIIFMFIYSNAFAAENRIDGLRPDAPTLANPGNHNIGVRTVTLYHKNQLDAANVGEDGPLPRYDRPLTVEIWYPANTFESGGSYNNVYLRDAKTQVTLYGKAVRDEKPLKANTPYPLVVISHGYPGNRLLMSHFGENLASKGYVVVSIDHTDSMYQDAGAFASTLYNRPRDQLFILSEMKRLNADENHFLYGMVDADNAGLMGYSMGGYGALITAGAGITEEVVNTESISPQGILKPLLEGTNEHKKLVGSSLNYKAVIAFAPWGMERGFWSDTALASIDLPMMFITGSEDDTSGYETGTRAIYEKTTGTDRYLLTFASAGHNAIAPIPAPTESWDALYNDGENIAYTHYTDMVWDSVRANNIAQHFVTAYFGKYLKDDDATGSYLDLTPDGNTANRENPWTGFKSGTTKGLKLEFLPKK